MYNILTSTISCKQSIQWQFCNHVTFPSCSDFCKVKEETVYKMQRHSYNRHRVGRTYPPSHKEYQSRNLFIAIKMQRKMEKFGFYINYGNASAILDLSPFTKASPPWTLLPGWDQSLMCLSPPSPPNQKKTSGSGLPKWDTITNSK